MAKKPKKGGGERSLSASCPRWNGAGATATPRPQSDRYVKRTNPPAARCGLRLLGRPTRVSLFSTGRRSAPWTATDAHAIECMVSASSSLEISYKVRADHG